MLTYHDVESPLWPGSNADGGCMVLLTRLNTTIQIEEILCYPASGEMFNLEDSHNRISSLEPRTALRAEYGEVT